MIRAIRVNLKFLCAVVIPAMFLISCSKSFDSVSKDYNSAFPASANVKVVHAAPKLFSLEIGFDNDKIPSNGTFSYGYYTNYISVTTGNNVVKAFKQGSYSPLVSKTISFDAQKYYTVFITDTASKLSLVTLADGNPPVPGKDSVKLRFANMSPDAGAVDIYIDGNATAVATNISYTSASSFMSYKASNDAVFVLKPTGQSSVLATSAKMNLLNGKFYTIMSSGFKNLSDDGKIVLSAILH